MREFLQAAALILGVIVGTLWASIGLLLAGIGWVTVRRHLASIAWPQVPVRILSSEVRTVRRLEGQLLYQPVVSYSFADAVEGDADSLSLVGKLYGSEERARKQIEKFPAGMVVTARRNPQDRQDAVLKGEGGAAGVLILLSGFTLAAIPLAVAARFGLPVWPLTTLLVLLAAIALFLDRSSRRQLLQARRSGIYPPQGQGSDIDVERLLRHQQKNLAIRLYREIHTTDLRTARLRVEEMASRFRNAGDDGAADRSG